MWRFAYILACLTGNCWTLGSISGACLTIIWLWGLAWVRGGKATTRMMQYDVLRSLCVRECCLCFHKFYRVFCRGRMLAHVRVDVACDAVLNTCGFTCALKAFLIIVFKHFSLSLRPQTRKRWKHCGFLMWFELTFKHQPWHRKSHTLKLLMVQWFDMHMWRGLVRWGQCHSANFLIL